MPNRILRAEILDSDRVNSLSAEAEVFYRRLMSVVDDYGRFPGDWRKLRSSLYPIRTDQISREQIDAWLAECSTPLPGEVEPLVTAYGVRGKKFIQINNFGQRIRVESKYPGPEEREKKRELSAVCAQMPANAAHARSRRASTPTPTPTPTPPSHTTPTPTPADLLPNVGAEGVQREFVSASAAADEAKSQFEQLAEAYPEGGRADLDGAYSSYRARVAEETERRQLSREEVHREILDAILAWKEHDFRWLSGRVHSLKKFLADRMWLTSPLPVANGNGHGKPPPKRPSYARAMADGLVKNAEEYRERFG